MECIVLIQLSSEIAWAIDNDCLSLVCSPFFGMKYESDSVSQLKRSQMKPIFYSALFVLFLGIPSIAATFCDLKIGAGIISSKFVPAMANVCEFLKNAEEARQNLAM